MKNHVLRPLWVVLASIAVFMVVRQFIVKTLASSLQGSTTANLLDNQCADRYKIRFTNLVC